ncbi:MAG: hypothetical protein J5I28_09360 [Acidimicrobiales bacterium]|jgi:shikimate dehydrogenase|nr:hypothetical protein [Acidimicrobiales bacterium]HLV91230.1 hypothetical protein [Acidimicrobiia bacterium]
MLRFAVVGDPIAQSRSPVIHTEALRLAGLEGEYTARRVLGGGLGAIVEEIRAGLLDGVNVTMPLKGEAYEAADVLTTEAERSASVNTLRLRDGVIEAHSTDTVAFGEIFDRVTGPAQLLILGAGGSARAALAAWTGGEVYVSARAMDRAAALGRPVQWGEGVDDAVVVNATPLGMAGESLPPAVLERASFLVDLPYGPAPTPAVETARKAGIELVDGLEFLAIQAEAAFRWWTGETVDLNRLIEVARNG